MPYFGGKTRLAPQIAALLPSHRHYVEPFCGSLAVLLAKPRSPMETANDLDETLVKFWGVLRDRPDDLARAAALTPHARAEHAAAYRLDEPGLDDLERARRVWVQLTQGRSAKRRPTGWRQYVKPAGSTSMPGYLDGYLSRILPAAERLHGVSLECRPALDVIERYGAHPEVLLYVDPPYLDGTRPGSSRGYVHEMRTEAEHRELAVALHAARAAVVLSGYPSALYDELYPDWHRHLMVTGTGQGAGWQGRTEVLWSNRPLSARLQTDAPAELQGWSA
jgi:DNA adenine methylase